MANKKETEYFTRLADCTALGREAADMLQREFLHFKSGSPCAALSGMEQVVREANSFCRRLAEDLMKEFLPPIDREDLYLLSRAAAHVTESLLEALRFLAIVPVSTLRVDAIVLAEDAVKCCSALDSLMQELPAIHKSGKLSPMFPQLAEYKDAAGKHYAEGLQRLFSQRLPVMEVYIWQELYVRLYNSCDASQNAADYIMTVLLKNS